MSLESFEPDQAEVIALLQPFVDGELSDEERELVAGQIAVNPDYQVIVREQQRVRAALRELERELAPAQLRERILADLDAVEAERRAAGQRGWFAPVVGRIRAFGKGAALMIPAAAAAVALFVVASDAGWLAGSPVDGAHINGGLSGSMKLQADRRPADADVQQVASVQAPVASPSSPPSPEPADPSLPGADQLGDNLGFAVQIAPPRSLPSDIALVSDSERSPGSSAMVRYRGAAGTLLVDRQRKAGVAGLHGLREPYQGHDYYLSRDQRGRPQVEFQVDRVHHSLALEGADAQLGAPVSIEEPDFHQLLVVADILRRAHER